MAGIKGRSGGPRLNSGGVRENSGGSRPGAGRKKKSAANNSAVEVTLEDQPHGGALKRKKSTPVPIAPTDMLTLLQNVALGITEATTTQVRAAIAAVQYTHVKKGDGGKRDELLDAAKKAGSGKFKAAPAPLKLVR